MVFINYIQLDFISLFCELFLFISSIVLLMFGVFFVSLRDYKYVNFVREFQYMIVFVLIIGALLIWTSPITNLIVFNSLLSIDSLVINVKLLLLLITICCLLVSFNYLKKEKFNLFEYNILILMSIIGLLCFISANDLISFYLALELQSLCFYILATFNKDSAFSTEAGLKYFILGALSSGFLLFGISLIYGATGTTNFETLAKAIYFFDFNVSSMDEIGLRIVLGSLFILMSLFFKLTAAPFHLWAPDVYEGAPTPVSLLFAAVPKLGIFIILIKLFFILFYDFISFWQDEIIFCSLLSILIGTFSALRQVKIKRFLALSSVTHVGFLLIAFATGTLEGLSSLLFYMVIYILMTVNAWSILLFLEYKQPGKRLRYISDFQNLSKSHPLLAFTLSINLFSMAGVPPLAGFFSKMLIFFVGLESSLNFIVIVGIILSVVSAFYYVRFIKIIYFDGITQGFYFQTTQEYNTAYIIGFTFLVIFFLFINPNLLLLFTKSLAINLFSSI